MKEKLKKEPLEIWRGIDPATALHQLRAARASVAVIKILVRDVINGSAKRLLEVQGAQAKQPSGLGAGS